MVVIVDTRSVMRPTSCDELQLFAPPPAHRMLRRVTATLHSKCALGAMCRCAIAAVVGAGIQVRRDCGGRSRRRRNAGGDDLGKGAAGARPCDRPGDRRDLPARAGARAGKQLEQTHRVPARRVLLPIAHATALAGSVTLIGTSSNLLIAGIASDADVEASMLSFAPVALPVCLVGWVLLRLASPRMLSGEAPVVPAAMHWRVELPIAAGAISVGKRPADIGIERTQEYALDAIVRDDATLPSTQTIAAGDLLVFSASETGVSTLWQSPRFGQLSQRLSTRFQWMSASTVHCAISRTTTST